MADTSNLSQYLKDVASAIKEKTGKTDKIPAANFDTEIRSIETGIDTSDATATASDMISGKTAYVNGEKIEGIMELVDTYTKQAEGVNMDDTTQTYSLTAQNYGRRAIEDGGRIWMNVSYSILANNIGLTGDKIVAGNTILGVEGTAQVGELTEEEYNNCLALTNSILSGTESQS